MSPDEAGRGRYKALKNKLLEKYKHLIGKQVLVHVWYKTTEVKTLVDVEPDEYGWTGHGCWFVTGDGRKWSTIEEVNLE